MKIAMVSEHASPLAALGGVDAGGQNVHVAALSEAIGRRGDELVVHSRRDSPYLPERVAMASGVEVHHIDAGPAAALPKDELLPYMSAFAERLEQEWRRERPDVVHSHFWMSGWAALRAATALGIPVAHTFHALGVVKRRYQGRRDTSPAERIPIEAEIVRRVEERVAPDLRRLLLRRPSRRHRLWRLRRRLLQRPSRRQRLWRLRRRRPPDRRLLQRPASVQRRPPIRLLTW